MKKFLFAFFLTVSLFAEPKYVVIISYAEFDAQFNLSTKGKERAATLAPYFTETLSLFYNIPSTIFGARQTEETLGGTRVMETATPTSGALGEQLHLSFAQDKPQVVVDFILNNPDYNNKTVLVVWDFDFIPELIDAFGYLPPLPPIPPRYDLTYVLPFPFTPPQQPIILFQSLLYGDGGFSPGPPGPPGPPPPPPPPGAYVPFTITDDTNLPLSPNGDIYIVIKGQNASGQSCYVSFPQGTGCLPDGTGCIPAGFGVLQPVSDSTSSFPFAYRINRNATTTFNIPPMTSGRIYFSIGFPMDLIVIGNIIQDPDALKEPSLTQGADSNYYTLYDKIEFTIPVDGTLPKITMNPTAVDFFCLPIKLSISNPSSATTGMTAASRPDVFTSVKATIATVATQPAASTQWNQLLIPDPVNPIPANTNYLRIAATAKAMTANPPRFDPNYLNNTADYGYSWIANVWDNYYKTTGLNHPLSIDAREVHPSNPIYTGRVQPVLTDPFVFTDPPGSDPAVFIGKPLDSIPFFQGSGQSFTFENKTVGSVLVRDLTAAVMTGIIPVTLTGGNPPVVGTYLSKEDYFIPHKADYYPVPNNPNLPGVPTVGVPWYDVYSKALHEVIPGYVAPTGFNEIYTFAYDDVLAIDGTIDSGGTSTTPNASITLNALNDGGGTTIVPDPYTDTTVYNVNINVGANNYVIYQGVTYTTGNHVLAVTGAQGKLLKVKTLGTDHQEHTTNIYIKYQLTRPAFPGYTGIVIDPTLPTATIAFPGF